VGLGALLSARLLRGLPGSRAPGIDDGTFVATWVDMMCKAIEA
jgi:hypothetical protein